MQPKVETFNDVVKPHRVIGGTGFKVKKNSMQMPLRQDLDAIFTYHSPRSPIRPMPIPLKHIHESLTSSKRIFPVDLTQTDKKRISNLSPYIGKKLFIRENELGPKVGERNKFHKQRNSVNPPISHRFNQNMMKQ